MSDITAGNSGRLVHGKALCWAARVIPLAVGLAIGLPWIAFWIVTSIKEVTDGDGLWPILGLLGLLCSYLIPLLAALIAWRWHLLGGMLLVLGGATLYLFFVLGGDMQWGVHLYVPPLLLGGILHLLVWRKEKVNELAPRHT